MIFGMQHKNPICFFRKVIQGGKGQSWVFVDFFVNELFLFFIDEFLSKYCILKDSQKILFSRVFKKVNY